MRHLGIKHQIYRQCCIAAPFVRATRGWGGISEHKVVCVCLKQRTHLLACVLVHEVDRKTKLVIVSAVKCIDFVKCFNHSIPLVNQEFLVSLSFFSLYWLLSTRDGKHLSIYIPHLRRPPQGQSVQKPVQAVTRSRGSLKARWSTSHVIQDLICLAIDFNYHTKCNHIVLQW